MPDNECVVSDTSSLVNLKQELDALSAAGFWISDELYSKILTEAK